ncbi:prolyl-tRNA synthetase [Candidatus Parcubacteria bacterium]|nr:prolyl-tRNA synthetase [Candidatus Parcubacteria bacterium]
MRQSQLFTKTSKNVPADETARNAQLLIQAGYVHKEMAGVYSYLPLGLAVAENIKQIVREEMNAIGGQELIMSSLQSRETWEKTDRWSDEIVDIWFKSKLKNGTEVGLAWSHEEAIIQMMKNHLSSYKDLPANVYQFQTKLRNELRAKSGVMRGREFVMKDMYSCSLDADQHEDFYQKSIEAYHRVFSRLGIGEETFLTVASGGAFTEFSHEFQTICEAGEDAVYLSRDKKIAVNEEVFTDEVVDKLGLKRDELERVKTAEVGNIFNFDTIKSKEMDFKYTNEAGESQFVHLGSYGIGITRLIGVLVEKFADKKGLVWPANIAPYQVYLASLGIESKIIETAKELYEFLQSKNINVLYDDRDIRPGQKFADADLTGIPCRVVISEKSLGKGGFEFQKRTEENAEIITKDELIKRLAK